MGGRFNKCFCPPIPAEDEFKQLNLSVPWMGFFTKFSSFAPPDQGDYAETKYTTYVDSMTNHTGTSTITETFDEDSGYLTNTNVTDPGFSLSGAFGYVLVSESVSNTHCSRIRTYSYINPNPPFNTLTGTNTWTLDLDGPLDFTTKMEEWRTRFETILPLADMENINDLTFRAVSGSGNVTSSLCLPSEHGAASNTPYQYMQIKPEYVAPWDGTYRIQYYANQGLVSPNYIDSIPNAFGASPMFPDQLLIANQPPSGSDDPLFVSTLLSLNHAINCSAALTNNRDCALVTFDESDGSISPVSAGVEVSPGKYAINGVATEVFSGAISGVGNLNISGFGWVRNRVDLSDSGNSFSTLYHIDDACAP